MSDQRSGLLAGLGAYLIWGFVPLYFQLLKPASAIEILGHRIVWAAVFVVGLVVLMRQWKWLARARREPRLLATAALAALLVAVNWGTFIWASTNQHVVETSLGYFINPLLSVVLAVVVLKERLRTPQWAAVGVGIVAVVVLTVDYGRPPWIALTLASSFGLYGLVKKKLGAPAIEGLAVESTVLLPLALGYLVWLQFSGGNQFGEVSVLHTVLVISSGVVTAIPLLLFAEATNRVPLSTMGILQYVTPLLQLMCGVVILHEPMPAPRLAGFALVWLALAVFTVDGLRNHRRQVAIA